MKKQHLNNQRDKAYTKRRTKKTSPTRILFLSLIILLSPVLTSAARCTPDDCSSSCTAQGCVCTGISPQCVCDCEGSPTGFYDDCGCINGNPATICSQTNPPTSICEKCHDIWQTCICDTNRRPGSNWPYCDGNTLVSYREINLGPGGQECYVLERTNCTTYGANYWCDGSPGNAECVSEETGCVKCGDGTWDCRGVINDNQRCGDNNQIGEIVVANLECKVNDDKRFLCCEKEWYSCDPTNTWPWVENVASNGETRCGYCCDYSQTGNYRWSYCGDGKTNTVCGEECDDGNSISGDGCSSSCQLEGCANCGDSTWDCTGSDYNHCGNNGDISPEYVYTASTDTCNPSSDTRFLCSGGKWHVCRTGSTTWPWVDGTYNTGGEVVGGLCCDPSTNPNFWTRCGDGLLNTVCGEECDDGNNNNGDGCSATCKWENEICTLSTGDEDKDGLTNWDSSDGIHGDDDCPVSVTSISVNNSAPYENSLVTITCTININERINSVFAYIDENSNNVFDTGIDRDCGWTEGEDYWLTNNQVVFTNCNAGSGGSKQAACGIYSSPSEPFDKSYQAGGDVTTSLLVGSCGDGAVNEPYEECDPPGICEPGGTGNACNASCAWTVSDSENSFINGCNNSIDDDCDSLIDGKDADCPEGSGNTITSPHRACDDGLNNDPENDNPEVLIDLDDDGCCDKCISQGYGYDTSTRKECGTPDCDCGTTTFEWENPAIMQPYCCGDDDPEENYITTTIGTNTYHACCDQPTDCVDQNGNCQIGQEETMDLCIDGQDNDCDGLIDISDTNCTALLQGYVFNQKGIPIGGATITSNPPGLGPPYQKTSTPTTTDGHYTLNPLVGTYTFIARKKGYDDNISIATITSGKTTQLNFTLRNGSCHADCTDYNGNCNPACHNTTFTTGETCKFIHPLCYNRPKGFTATLINKTTNTITEYTCCEGPTKTYPLMKTKIKGDVENLYDYVINVKLGGRRVKMHILTWE